MSQTDLFWRFVCENGERHLDCELLTASGIYFTNRCFLQLSGWIGEIVGEGNFTILMPDFSHSDVKKIFRGYFSTQKKNFNQDIQSTEHVSTPRFMPKGEGPLLQKTDNHLPSMKGDNSPEIQRPLIKQKIYQCDICGLTFTSPKKSWNHKDQVHRSDFVFKCEVCSAQFKTKSILTNHMKSHKSPSFPCKFCSKGRPLNKIRFSNLMYSN